MMKTNRLKIVLDTNVFLVFISPHSQYHWIFENLITGNYKLPAILSKKTNQMMQEICIFGKNEML